jgi:hypothetical protein
MLPAQIHGLLGTGSLTRGKEKEKRKKNEARKRRKKDGKIAVRYIL